MFQPCYLHLLKKISLIQKAKINQNAITVPEIINMSNYKIINEIGRGSYSTVYAVKEISTNRKFALKKSIANDLEEVEKIKKEIRFVSSLYLNIVSNNLIQQHTSFISLCRYPSATGRRKFLIAVTLSQNC